MRADKHPDSHGRLRDDTLSPSNFRERVCECIHSLEGWVKDLTHQVTVQELGLSLVGVCIAGAVITHAAQSGNTDQTRCTDA